MTILMHVSACRKISNNLMIIIRYESFVKSAKIDLMTNFGLVTDASLKIVL